MENVFAALVVVGLSFAFIGIRVLLGKDKSFRGSCGSMNVTGNNGEESCSICGRKSDEACGSEEEAMKLYNDNLDNCTEIEGDAFDRYDYKFYSIEENKCQIIESLKETL